MITYKRLMRGGLGAGAMDAMASAGAYAALAPTVPADPAAIAFNACVADPANNSAEKLAACYAAHGLTPTGRPASGYTPGRGGAPSFFTPQPPMVQEGIKAAAASGGEAYTACADPRLTNEAQRAYCAESYQAGLRGGELIINALAKDACNHAVQQGLISPEDQITCVRCARASIAGEFDPSLIPQCVQAGGPNDLTTAVPGFLSRYKVPLIVGGVVIAGLGAWFVLR